MAKTNVFKIQINVIIEAVMKMKRIFKILVCLCLIFVSGCSIDQPKACATNYPVYYLLNRIVGGYVEICNLSTNELIQRAHVVDNFAEELESATVIFTLRPIEPYYEIYADDFANSDATKIDLSQTSAIYEFKRYTNTLVDNQVVTVENNYYEGDIFKDIDMYNQDVTLWMDPISMMSMADTILQYFVKTYPDNAYIFEENYKQLEVELAQLDAAFQSLKDSGKEIKIVTMTPNFGNWQKSYGFGIYPIVLSRYGALPSESQLEAIIARIQQDGVRYIAHEENLPEDMEALFTEIEERLQLTRIELNNISSITEESINSNKDYLTLMYENLAALEALE